jgi:hypothetical protein
MNRRMQIGCGNGLGLGLVSEELLAGERTDSWTWSHTGRKLSFLFSSFFSSPYSPGEPWMPTTLLFLVITATVWIPFVFLSLRDRDSSVNDYIGGPESKKHLQLFLSISPSNSWRPG